MIDELDALHAQLKSGQRKQVRDEHFWTLHARYRSRDYSNFITGLGCFYECLYQFFDLIFFNDFVRDNDLIPDYGDPLRIDSRISAYSPFSELEFQTLVKTQLSTAHLSAIVRSEISLLLQQRMAQRSRLRNVQIDTAGPQRQSHDCDFLSSVLAQVAVVFRDIEELFNPSSCFENDRQLEVFNLLLEVFDHIQSSSIDAGLLGQRAKHQIYRLIRFANFSSLSTGLQSAECQSNFVDELEQVCSRSAIFSRLPPEVLDTVFLVFRGENESQSKQIPRAFIPVVRNDDFTYTQQSQKRDCVTNFIRAVIELIAPSRQLYRVRINNEMSLNNGPRSMTLIRTKSEMLCFEMSYQ